MAKVLIATLYNPNPIFVASNRLGPDRLILLLSKNPPKEQKESYKLISESLGRVVDVKKVEIDMYNIVEIAKKAVEIIDMQPKNDDIYVNITGGRKTQALGLLFAAYVRNHVIKGIAYNPEEDKTAVVWLPKLCFKLTDSQRKVMEILIKEDTSCCSYTDLAEKVGISRAMFYRNIEELKNQGYLNVDDGLKVTDAGYISML